MGFNADIIVWDFIERKEKFRLNLHKVEVKSLCFSCDDAFLGSLGGQDDNSLVVWDMLNGNAICGTPAGNDSAQSVRFFNNDPHRLVTAGNYHITSWRVDLQNKKLRPSPCSLGGIIFIRTSDHTRNTKLCDDVFLIWERDIFGLSVC